MGNIGAGKIIGIIFLVLIVAGFGALLLFDKLEQDAKSAEFNSSMAQEREERRAKDKRIAEILDVTKAVSEKEIPGIVVWGDEYAACGKSSSVPDSLSKIINHDLFGDINTLLNSSASLSSYSMNINVVNNGIQGETLYTMAARIGAYPTLTAEEYKLPADTSGVKMDFKTTGDQPVQFVSQNHADVGGVTLGDEKGTMSIKKNGQNGYYYYFSKNKPSEAKTVKAGTRLYTEGEEACRDDLLIMFFGRDDYDSVKELVSIQRAVAEHQNENRRKYIAVSQTEEGSELDKAMKKEFGEHYLRIDPYENTGKEYNNVAQAIYDKFVALGYADEVKKSVDSALSQIKSINAE